MKNNFSKFHTGLVLILFVCITGCTGRCPGIAQRFPICLSPAQHRQRRPLTDPAGASSMANTAPVVTASAARPPRRLTGHRYAGVFATPYDGAYPLWIQFHTQPPPRTTTPTKAPTPTQFYPTHLPKPPRRSTPAERRPRREPSPEKWQDWPIVPVVSQHAARFTRLASTRPTIPPIHRFSKVGDCQNIRQYFLGSTTTLPPTAWGLKTLLFKIQSISSPEAGTPE